MQKYKILIVKIILSILIISLLIIPITKANYINPDIFINKTNILLGLPPIFIINFTIEYIIIYLFIRKNIIEPQRILTSTIWINLISFFPTQLIVWGIFSLVLPGLYYSFTETAFIEGFIIIIFLILFIESIPIIIESRLFNKQFDKLYYNCSLIEQISVKNCIKYILTANLTTFIIGLCFFINLELMEIGYFY